MLERVIDKVFANLNIDVEFTKHFLDQVNNERNKKQITIRELGELFAKEYKRWGNTIKHMPVDSQAVMKDLSSAINIPFVLNKDGKEKELVAKTVMRKKDFKTPDKQLPVESVSETDGKSLNDIVWAKNVIKPGSKRTLRKEFKAGDKVKYGGSVSTVVNYDQNGFVTLSNPNWSKNRTVPYTAVKLVQETVHGAKKGSQVKGHEPTPAKSKPSKGGETPHPMRGRLVGESESVETVDVTHNGVTYKAAQGGYWDPVNKKRYRFPEDVKDPMLRRILFPDHGKRLGGAYVGEKSVNEGWKHNIFSGRTTDGVNFTVDKLARKNPRYLVRYDNDDKAAFDNLMVYYDDFETVMNITKQTFDDAIAGGEQFQRTKKTAFGGANQFIKPVKKQDVNEVAGGTVVKTVNGYPIHDMGAAYPWPNKRFAIRDLYLDVWQASAPTLADAMTKANGLKPGRGPMAAKSQDEIEHDNWRDEQRARLATGEVRRAVMSRRGLGEAGADETETLVYAFTNKQRRNGWDVYVSRMAFRGPRDYMLEFEKDGEEFEIVGDEGRWELFFGPNLSGRGKEFSNLEDAFQTAAVSSSGYTPEAVSAAWESYRDLDEKLIDPREAILAKALKYLDKKIQLDGGRQSLGGYAFDVGREINLSQLGVTAKELARLYREWKGDSVVTEGWMEHNLYYLDEVIREDNDPCWDGYKQVGMKKKKGKQVPNCVPKKKK